MYVPVVSRRVEVGTTGQEEQVWNSEKGKREMHMYMYTQTWELDLVLSTNSTLFNETHIQQRVISAHLCKAIRQPVHVAPKELGEEEKRLGETTKLKLDESKVFMFPGVTTKQSMPLLWQSH